jgi:hypothetical protein
MTDEARSLSPAAVIVHHPVADFDAWKVGFDAHEGARRAAGILGHHINRGRDDAHDVSIYLAVSDIDRARAFAESDDLKNTMRDVGVTGPPTLTWVTPVREAVVWDRELPAMIVSHSVSDFDRWLDAYDAAAEIQHSGGIIGHAANRSIDDPAVAIIYHQAESFATLEAFLAAPALQEAMKAAGVIAEPEVSFHIGGWAATY